MDHAKRLSLCERQFLQFAFSRLIRFGLAVRSGWELIVRLKRDGGPLAKALTRVRHPQRLDRANREQKDKQPVGGEPNHDALPP